MFRLLLTAYLCLGAVFAPLLCCCALEHGARTSSARTCCGKSTATTSPSKAHAHHHDHAHYHPGGHRHAGHELAGTPASRVPDHHTPDSCPCDKLKFAAVRAEKVDVASGDGLAAWAYDVLALSTEDISDTSDVVSATSVRFTNGPPASLFGRGMLRAYHILRC